MNVKNYFTLAGIVGILYGALFFFATDKASELYSNAELSNELSVVLAKFLGASVLAAGIMVILARNASKSIGRTAILYYMAVSQILYLILNIMGMTAAAAGSMNYADLIVNIILGFGAVYFILKERGAEA
jgi:hypothetical protein